MESDAAELHRTQPRRAKRLAIYLALCFGFYFGLKFLGFILALSFRLYNSLKLRILFFLYSKVGNAIAEDIVGRG